MKSLLPLLRNDTLTGLKLNIKSTKTPESESSFELFDNSGLISRMVEGELIDPFNGHSRKILLYCQKDEYSLKAIDLDLNNRKIYSSWIRKIRQFRKTNTDTGLDRLSSENEVESINPQTFEPLFACKYKCQYFHPPCPRCGKKLSLCTDDDLLSQIGAQLYSNSLKRYLYCHDCSFTTNGTTLFSKSFTDKDRENDFIKNESDLFFDFKNLEAVSFDRSTHFPCNSCEEYPACYGSFKKVLERLCSFAFYPFFLIVIDRDIFNYKNVLEMISSEGKQSEHKKMAEQLRHQSQRNTNNKVEVLNTDVSHVRKEYVKVLLIKLRLIKQIARFVLDNTNYLFFPDCGFDPEKIWFRVIKNDEADKNNWHFNLSICDMGSLAPPFNRNGAFDHNYGKKLLITIWIYTVLFFKDFSLTLENVETIINKVDQADSIDNNDLDFEKKLKQCLQESQIYQKHQKLLSLLGSEYESLILLTIKVGLSLLQEDWSGTSEQNHNRIVFDIDDLIKLSQSYLISIDYDIIREDNRKIAATLMNIRYKWSKNGEEHSSLKSDCVKKKKQSKPKLKEMVTDANNTDDWKTIPHTVIQSHEINSDPGTYQPASKNDDKKENKNIAWDAMPKTVVQNRVPETGQKEKKSSDWLDVPATIIQTGSEEHYNGREKDFEETGHKAEALKEEYDNDGNQIDRGLIEKGNVDLTKDGSWDALPKTVIQSDLGTPTENLKREDMGNRNSIDESETTNQWFDINGDVHNNINNNRLTEEENDFLTETILLSKSG